MHRERLEWDRVISISLKAMFRWDSFIRVTHFVRRYRYYCCYFPSRLVSHGYSAHVPIFRRTQEKNRRARDIDQDTGCRRGDYVVQPEGRVTGCLFNQPRRNTLINYAANSLPEEPTREVTFDSIKGSRGEVSHHLM